MGAPVGALLFSVEVTASYYLVRYREECGNRRCLTLVAGEAVCLYLTRGSSRACVVPCMTAPASNLWKGFLCSIASVVTFAVIHTVKVRSVVRWLLVCSPRVCHLW